MAMFNFLAFNSGNALTLWRNEGNWKAMFATQDVWLDAKLKTMKAIPDLANLKTIGNRFQFPSFRRRINALPELNARK